MKKTFGVIMLSLAAILLFGGIIYGMHLDGYSWIESIITVIITIVSAATLGVLIVYGLKFLTEE